MKWLCNDSVVMQRICNIKGKLLESLESFSLCIAQYESKDQQKNIHKRWKMLHTVLHYYTVIHVYTFCCSSYTCITSFLFELYMYNFILLFELCITSFLFELYMYNSNPVFSYTFLYILIHSFTFLYILIHSHTFLYTWFFMSFIDAFSEDLLW